MAFFPERCIWKVPSAQSWTVSQTSFCGDHSLYVALVSACEKLAIIIKSKELKRDCKGSLCGLDFRSLRYKSALHCMKKDSCITINYIL